jgi:hypothetical protein
MNKHMQFSSLSHCNLLPRIAMQSNPPPLIGVLSKRIDKIYLLFPFSLQEREEDGKLMEMVNTLFGWIRIARCAAVKL